MTKFYEVRCTVSAVIVELWRVKAESDESAIELVDSGQGEFIRQVDCDDESERRDFQALEVSGNEFAALAQSEAMRDASPDMLAALEGELKSAEFMLERAPIFQPKYGQSKADIQATIDYLRAVIAKAKGEGA
jgi:hypothetical protein